jgi:hypothetical protein
VAKYSAYKEADLIAALKMTACMAGAPLKAQLELIAACDQADIWRHDDYRDMAQWVAINLGVSITKARRMVGAARAIESLPRIAGELAAGRLSLDKTLELCRFATPADEEELLKWAQGAAVGAIKERADLACRIEPEEVKTSERARYLNWNFDDDNLCLWFNGRLPQETGHRFVKVIEAIAKDIPVSPEDVTEWNDGTDARYADALMELVSGGTGGKRGRDTVIVHAPLASLLGEGGNCQIEGGPVIHPGVASRLMCDCKLQFVVYDETGMNIGITEPTLNIPNWLEREVRYRDGGRCTFRGCGSKHFLHTHHMAFRGADEGPSVLRNLTTLCSYHHKLVHEMGWRVYLNRAGEYEWFRPDGTRYRGPPAKVLATT